MPKQNPTATGGGAKKKRKNRKTPLFDPKVFPGADGHFIMDQLAQKNRSPIGAAPAAPPVPGVVVNNAGAGQDIIAKIRAAQQGNTQASPAPHVLSPNNISRGGAAISATLGMTGGKGPGRISRLANSQAVPSVDTSLDPNLKGVKKRAKNAAQLEYNPQIEAVKALIGSTRNEANRDITDAQSAYAALANQIRSDVPKLGANFDSGQAQSAAIYQQLQDQINQKYNATEQSNAAEFERLGISAATPNANGRLTSDRDFLSSIAGLQGANANSVLETQQQGAQANLMGQAGLAGLAGANTAKDIRSNLADRLLELRSNKTSLIGSRAKSRRELQDQYRDEATAQAERDRAFGLDVAQFKEGSRQNNIQNAMADREFRYGRTMDRAGMALDAAKLQQDASQGAEVDLKSLDPQERAAYKADQLVPGSGDKLYAGLQSLINSNQNIRRGYYTHQDASGREVQVKITPQQFGYIARKLAKKTGIPAGSIQKIAEAYWAEQ